MKEPGHSQAGKDLVGPAGGSPENPEEQEPHDQIVSPAGAGKGLEDFPVYVLVIERGHNKCLKCLQ
jgi:hypothetical protein